MSDSLNYRYKIHSKTGSKIKIKFADEESYQPKSNTNLSINDEELNNNNSIQTSQKKKKNNAQLLFNMENNKNLKKNSNIMLEFDEGYDNSENKDDFLPTTTGTDNWNNDQENYDVKINENSSFVRNSTTKMREDSGRRSKLYFKRQSFCQPLPRMGRRFTLNPLIFAKEERDARRQSLAQLKLSYYPTNANPDVYDVEFGICSWFLMFFSWLILLFTFPITICFCVKVVQEYERAVIFRLGRLIGGGARGPGLFFVLPCIESYTKVDLRTVSFSVPPQEILTRDSVTVSVDAVVYYRICNATVSVANVENAHHSTRLLAQTTLRNMLGTRNLSEILSDRDNIAGAMQTLLDEATESWGIKVERVEIKDVRLPVQLQRAMAAEAEAAREARAKIIAAEGEQKASRSLREAASTIAMSPAAIQLRYLQTLNTVAAEKNSTIIFPLPMEIIRHWLCDKNSNPKSS